MYLKTLTELDGISGNEETVSSYIMDICNPFLDLSRDSMYIDKLGNLIIFKKGTMNHRDKNDRNFRVMLCSHMDEIGLLITGHTDKGALRFRPVGAIDVKILPGMCLAVGEKHLSGVVGLKPLHLKKKEEGDKQIECKDLYIDIGAATKEEALAAVGKGEYAGFISEYEEYGKNRVKSKALDDRSGCCVLIEILKEHFEFDLYLCFSVQEEIGLRGAETAAYVIEPDIAVIVEGTTCSDILGVEIQDYATVSGEGAALTIKDNGTIPDKKLSGLIAVTADKYKIKMQYRQTTAASNDAASIQGSRKGVKVAALSIPCRYIHSPNSILDKRDLDSCRELLNKFLHELEKDKCTLLFSLIGGTSND